MAELLPRVFILLCVSLLIWTLIWAGRRYVASQRRCALAAEPPGLLPHEDTPAELGSAPQARVRILAFSSEDCSQCHTLQAPALERLKESYEENVVVIEIDAPRQPALVERYRVLTVPTTVVLDTSGRAHAVNYGFADARRLRSQVDEMLAGSVA